MMLWEFLVKKFGFHGKLDATLAIIGENGTCCVMLNGFYANNPDIVLTNNDEISVMKKFSHMEGW